MIQQFWNNLGITHKFSLTFSIMLCFVVLLCAISYGTLSTVHRQTVNNIQVSFNVQKLVLEMDRGIEKARRIKHEFLLKSMKTNMLSQNDDFADQVYSQLLKVSKQSKVLKNLIFQPNTSEALRKNYININLYYSISNRCNVVFKELLELVRKLITDENALQNLLGKKTIMLQYQLEKSGNHKISSQFDQMQLYVKEYLLTRQRPFIQSALNVAFFLDKEVSISTSMQDRQKADMSSLIKAYTSIIKEISELDVMIQTKSNDFDLNTETLESASAGLVKFAEKEVERSQAENEYAVKNIGIVFFITALSGFFLIGCLAYIVHRTITRNIVRLTNFASKLQSGNLDVQYQLKNNDELGHLSESFNQMTLRLKELVNGLEGQVEKRTKDLLTSNIALKKEMEERKLAEDDKYILEAKLRQAHKMEAIGTLAGGIAHDFNNILGIIIGNSELAMDDIPESNPARLNMEGIMTASVRAKDIVQQLLSFSRKTEQEKQIIKLQSIVKETLVLLRSTIPATIEIQHNIADDPGSIKADPSQIHQVIVNLCTNAAHAMETDGGILEIHISQAELDEITKIQFTRLKPGQYIQLTISDTGNGIDQEIIGKIFDPYFTTKEFGRGTGMGLSIVHGIITNHDGSISVYSEHGKGTTFKILLPVVNEILPVKTEKYESMPRGCENILIVDDEDYIVEVGQKILERLGYHVDIHTNPEAALKAVLSDPDKYNLIITDMTMPKLTGDDLSQRILEIRPDMPIILCTGFSKKIDRNRANIIGIRDYIEKPLNRYKLSVTVRTVLDEHEQKVSSEKYLIYGKPENL